MAKIVLLSPWAPPPDGVAFHSLALVTAWRKASHQVLIVTSRVRGDRSHSRATVVDSGVSVLRSLSLVPRRTTSQVLSEFQPDFVVVQFAIASQGTTLLSTLRIMGIVHRLGLPVVVAFHEPAREIERLGPLSRWIYRAAANATTHPVVYSSAGADALVKAALFMKVAEVPHGCQPTFEATIEDLTRVRERYRVTSPLVLSLGFTHIDKGTDLLVRAMEDTAVSLGGEVQFLFAGSPRPRQGIFRLVGRADKKFHQKLTSEIRRCRGVSVELCSFVPGQDMVALLNLASAVVLPYRRATQSGIANDALAAHAVVVASDIPELYNDLGLAARYFQSESVSDLVKTLVAVLSNPQDDLRDAAATRAGERSYESVAAYLVNLGLSEVDASS